MDLYASTQSSPRQWATHLCIVLTACVMDSQQESWREAIGYGRDSVAKRKSRT